MVYAKIVDGVISYYPASLDLLFYKGVLSNPRPSQEEMAAANVVEITQPFNQKPNDGYNYTLKPIQQQDGSWIEDWYREETPVDVFNTNVQIQKWWVDRERNLRLGYTDWVTIKSLETGVPVPDAWKVYRQALRDVTTQEGYPFNISWPTRPDAV